MLTVRVSISPSITTRLLQPRLQFPGEDLRAVGVHRRVRHHHELVAADARDRWPDPPTASRSRSANTLMNASPAL